MATISTLSVQVQNRLEETVGAGLWWSRQYELYSALMEAQNDLLLLVGRPTQIVNVPFSLTPNSVWQTVPKGYFIITDILGAGSPLYRINLWDLDYLQTSWGSDWTQDVDDAATKWAPIGFNMFVVHPAPKVGQTVLVSGIAYPTTDSWPYSGNEPVIAQDEFFVALEQYAAAYCRIKELGAEFEEGIKLMENYMSLARRWTQLSDLRDPLLFTMNYGAANNVNPTTFR